ncbi:MAG: AzlC family ABC transporter permease [Candidatus Limnocylindrales bacterium]
MTHASGLPMAEARRRLAFDIAGIVLSSGGFGIVFGLAAQKAGYSIAEAIAMSTIVFAGASQFAAVGLVVAATPWPAIVLVTALLNARHLLYSAALAPWLRGVSRRERAAMAHVLTDEAFALTLGHFSRLGRADPAGYWIAAIGSTFIPWNAGTIVGFLVGGYLASPDSLGIDVIFPAAMAGLAVGLVTGRRAVVAVAVAVIVAVVVALAWDPRAAAVIGGLVGPLAGLAVPGSDEPIETPESLAADPGSAGHDPQIGVAP